MHKPPYVDQNHIPLRRKVGGAFTLWLLGCVVFGVPTALVIWLIWRWLL
jgi:hypothetical protein